MDKVYIFGNEATALAFSMTAYHFFGDAEKVTRVGSALVMREEVYRTVMDNTYAVAAAVVALPEVS